MLLLNGYQSDLRESPGFTGGALRSGPACTPRPLGRAGPLCGAAGAADPRLTAPDLEALRVGRHVTRAFHLTVGNVGAMSKSDVTDWMQRPDTPGPALRDSTAWGAPTSGTKVTGSRLRDFGPRTRAADGDHEAARHRRSRTSLPGFSSGRHGHAPLPPGHAHVPCAAPGTRSPCARGPSCPRPRPGRPQRPRLCPVRLARGLSSACASG